MYQCYFIDSITHLQCKQQQDDYWCSDLHRLSWQQENYQDKRNKSERQLPIKEIQIRLHQLQLKKKEERFNKQQLLLET